MAKATRGKRNARTSGLPPFLTRFLDGLSAEPRVARLVACAMLLAVGLYASGLRFPLVYGDFSVLDPAALASYVQTHPVFGSRWLADATFGWTAKLIGVAWPGHRTINVLLHALNVWAVYVLVRRLARSFHPSPIDRLAGGWIAFFAAGLFAVHPVAVYGVAYLAERSAVLTGLFATIALWSTVRAAQERWRAACLIGPVACAAALAANPAALGIPIAMTVLALALGRSASAPQRVVWCCVGLSAAVACAYAVGYAMQLPAGFAVYGGYFDAVALASGRFMGYLAIWLVPVTAWMAIEIPEPLLPAAFAWTPLTSLVALAALVAALGAGMRRGGLLRLAAVSIACVLALYLPELLWPGFGRPFALSRSYAWMSLAAVPVVCLLASLPARAAFAGGCGLLAVWVALAAAVLQTFSSHVALWDDAVRRAERFGPVAADARIYMNRAAVHRRDGHLLAAIADYGRVLELQPDHSRALRGRAQAYIDDKRYDAALEDLDRLLEIEPGNPITHADRALALMQAGRLADAGNAFDRAIERGVREPRVFLNRALARLQMSGLEAAPAALADMERALELDPRYALAYFNRGLLFEEAAKAGIRLRDAVSPEIMRAVAQENMKRACNFGHRAACERDRAGPAQDAPPGAQEGPVRVTPETLRQQGLPSPR